MQQNSLSLVIPCYNPPENWQEILVQRYLEFTEELVEWNITLLLVNDGSTMNINPAHIQFIQNKIPSFQYLTYPKNKGKGHALRYAIKQVKTEITLYTDIDLPYTKNSMLSLLKQIPRYDIVMAIKEKKYYSQLPFIRKIISKTLQCTIKLLFKKMPTSDTQCGLKIMNSKGKEIFLTTSIDRYLFDLEFIYKASNHGLAIHLVPSELKPGIMFRKMDNKILIQEFKNFIHIVLTKK